MKKIKSICESNTALLQSKLLEIDGVVVYVSEVVLGNCMNNSRQMTLALKFCTNFGMHGNQHTHLPRKAREPGIRLVVGLASMMFLSYPVIHVLQCVPINTVP